MNSALRTAIYTLGKTVTGLSSSNFYHVQAKQGDSLPYCVFQGIDADFDYDSGTQQENSRVQFSFFGTTLSTLETIANNFKTKFDFGETSLTVSGYSVLRIDRTLDLPPRKENKVWQIILEYEFQLTKSRS
jgi:hypothetical protein